MTIRYLTLDDVLTLHEYAIRRWGGSLGLANPGRLDAALRAPQQTMFGQDLYPDIYAKAAILVYLLIQNHPFIDGNKRAGLYALLRFLHINGLQVAVTDPDELYQFTIAIATSALDKEEIAAWLRAHTVPTPERSSRP